MLYLKGMGMGAADVVPGVSGGTVAFLTGIYDRLLSAISHVPQAAGHLLHARIHLAWQAVDGGFLAVLLAGIFTSMLSLARLITYLLAVHPILIWSFFFGLILVSVYCVGREIRQRTWTTGLGFVVGLMVALWVTMVAPMQMGSDPLSIFMAGSIAICAMILPGISGSFILVLLGLYPVILAALKSLDWGVLLYFMGGCMVGLVCFAHILSWLLRTYRDVTLAMLVGLMLGSLNKVWPWKETLTWQAGSEGKQIPVLQQNLLPGSYEHITGQDAQLALALLLAMVGVGLVLGLEWHFQKREAGNNQRAQVHNEQLPD